MRGDMDPSQPGGGVTDWHGLHAVLCPGTMPRAIREDRPCRHPILWTPYRACTTILGGPDEASGTALVHHCRKCNSWVEIRMAA